MGSASFGIGMESHIPPEKLVGISAFAFEVADSEAGAKLGFAMVDRGGVRRLRAGYGRAGVLLEVDGA